MRDDASANQVHPSEQARLEDATGPGGPPNLMPRLRDAHEQIERLREELAAALTRAETAENDLQLALEAPSTESGDDTTGADTTGADSRAEMTEFEVELDSARAELDAIRAEYVELDDAVMLQQVGIYECHHPLENAAAFKARLDDLRDRIKDTVRAKSAIEASERFAYNNSLAQGRRMTADFSKLMLRAYNAEADNCVRSLRAGSIAAATKRLETAKDTIAKLGAMMEMRVTADYHALRVAELELTSDYLFKVQEEREAAREERERIREEKRAEAELAAERERLDKERAHYANALAALQAQGKDDSEIADVVARLEAIDGAIEQNDYRAANIRAGYVYVISNIGSFGPDVVKIGMTRRLDPMDRVKELGDASVPFTFDVHALFFADDAVTVENELHAAFAKARLNRVNPRKEFFFASPAQVRDVLTSKVGNLLDFIESPEAPQFFQSRSTWPARPAMLDAVSPWVETAAGEQRARSGGLL
ncbi:DUF4041 domain-containing protein [Nocardioides aequoreus]|uniref:DUF4041 domain-containing protein n=1 Tax=Nocardioides aequoreus TaxID=397278 RepID=UPI000A96F848|nr:DUF4041 domain-containing protein [Nocardioides aequoreus]